MKEILDQDANINPPLWIQMNFYRNPDGPALLSVPLEGFYAYQIEVSFKILAKLLNGVISH